MNKLPLTFAPALALIAAGCADPADQGALVTGTGDVVTESEADILEERMDMLEPRTDALESRADRGGLPVAEIGSDVT